MGSKVRTPEEKRDIRLAVRRFTHGTLPYAKSKGSRKLAWEVRRLLNLRKV